MAHLHPVEPGGGISVPTVLLVETTWSTWPARALAWVHQGVRPLRRLTREAFGPHFSMDLVRLARKGWTTAFRILYLVILLLGLSVMHASIAARPFTRLSQYADSAWYYSHVLVVLQDLAILMMMPIYMSTTIAEERESGTLEAMFLSQLGDRDIVLSKYMGRLAHLSVLVLATTPILTFLHLWGNVPIWFFAFRQTYAVLLMFTAGAVCVYQSAKSRTSFEAIVTSYPILFCFALFGELAIGMAPWAALFGTRWIPRILMFTPVLIFTAFAFFVLFQFRIMGAIELVAQLRLADDKKPQRTSTVMVLRDQDDSPVKRLFYRPDDEVFYARRGRRKRTSKIHPLALPIPDDALFWKECMKDGSTWSLTWNWFFWMAGSVLILALLTRVVLLLPINLWPIRNTALSFSHCFYGFLLALYALILTFQTTATVAGEREQDTLNFLLLVPDERKKILWMKWLGPFWRNWPILGISYLAAFAGAVSGVYGFFNMAMMWLLPIPLLLMLSGLALYFSVRTHRTVLANTAIVVFAFVFVTVHVVAFRMLPGLFPYYSSLIFGTNVGEFTSTDSTRALISVVIDLGFMTTVGLLGVFGAFRRFVRLQH